MAEGRSFVCGENKRRRRRCRPRRVFSVGSVCCGRGFKRSRRLSAQPGGRSGSGRERGGSRGIARCRGCCVCPHGDRIAAGAEPRGPSPHESCVPRLSSGAARLAERRSAYARWGDAGRQRCLSATPASFWSSLLATAQWLCAASSVGNCVGEGKKKEALARSRMDVATLAAELVCCQLSWRKKKALFVGAASSGWGAALGGESCASCRGSPWYGWAQGWRWARGTGTDGWL